MDKKEMLHNIDLSRFHVIEMTGAYSTNDDGRRDSEPIGFFKDAKIAAAFVGKDHYKETGTVFMLTDGETGFIIDTHTPVKFFDDEEEMVRLRKEAIAKLSPEDRAILGLE